MARCLVGPVPSPVSLEAGLRWCCDLGTGAWGLGSYLLFERDNLPVLDELAVGL